MNRLHVHIKVRDLDRSTEFYSTLFGRAPDVRKDDYAKWLLEDPRAHISLSTHGGSPGVDHVGISLDDGEALQEIAGRLESKSAGLFEEKATTCCYARSDKYWARDPDDVVWELFHTFGDSEQYGAEPDRALVANTQLEAACCAPTACGETC